MMTCKEMIEYLLNFKPEDEVSFVVADVKKRQHYKISKCFMLTESPASLLEVGEIGSLDDILEERDTEC